VIAEHHEGVAGSNEARIRCNCAHQDDLLGRPGHVVMAELEGSEFDLL
jgi:hypothetical protein